VQHGGVGLERADAVGVTVHGEELARCLGSPGRHVAVAQRREHGEEARVALAVHFEELDHLEPREHGGVVHGPAGLDGWALREVADEDDAVPREEGGAAWVVGRAGRHESSVEPLQVLGAEHAGLVDDDHLDALHGRAEFAEHLLRELLQRELPSGSRWPRRRPERLHRRARRWHVDVPSVVVNQVDGKNGEVRVEHDVAVPGRLSEEA